MDKKRMTRLARLLQGKPMDKKKFNKKPVKVEAKIVEKTADYQGWTNYETWSCALWFGNDGGTSDEIYNQIKNGDLKSQEEVEGYMKSLVEEGEPELSPSMYSDILSAGLGEINYREIAKNYWDDAEKPEVEAE